MSFDIVGLNPTGKNAGDYYAMGHPYWHAAWEYMGRIAPDVITLRDYRQGRGNNHHVIPATKARTIADRIELALKGDAYEDELEEIASDLPGTSDSEVSKLRRKLFGFARFARHSGGFRIS